MVEGANPRSSSDAVVTTSTGAVSAARTGSGSAGNGGAGSGSGSGCAWGSGSGMDTGSGGGSGMGIGSGSGAACAVCGAGSSITRGALDPEGVGIVDDPLQLLDRGAQASPLRRRRGARARRGRRTARRAGPRARAPRWRMRQARLGRVAVGLLAPVGEDGGGFTPGGGDERVGLLARLSHGGVGGALGQDEGALHLLDDGVVGRGRTRALGVRRLGRLDSAISARRLASTS